MSNGTYRIDLVRGAWVGAARKLEALAKGRRYDDASLNYLQVCLTIYRFGGGLACVVQPGCVFPCVPAVGFCDLSHFGLLVKC